MRATDRIMEDLELMLPSEDEDDDDDDCLFELDFLPTDWLALTMLAAYTMWRTIFFIQKTYMKVIDYTKETRPNRPSY